METPRTKEIMKEYLSTHKTDAYLSTYGARRYNNHHALIEVAEALKKEGCTCRVVRQDYEDKCVHLVYVEKEGKGTTYGFAEVPYRWYIDNECINDNCCGLVKGDSYAYPFDVEDILEKLREDRFEPTRFNSPYYVEI